MVVAVAKVSVNIARENATCSGDTARTHPTANAMSRRRVKTNTAYAIRAIARAATSAWRSCTDTGDVPPINQARLMKAA